MISFLLLTVLGIHLYAQGNLLLVLLVLLGLLLVLLGIAGGFYNIHRRDRRELHN